MKICHPEIRKDVCPLEYYWKGPYDLKPQWRRCIGMRSFQECGYFRGKEDCWKKFDEEVKK